MSAERWIDRWTRALSKVFVERAAATLRRQQGMTEVRHRSGAGAWRHINPEATPNSVGKRAARRHRQWQKATKRLASLRCAWAHERHDLGISLKHHTSARTLRRMVERARGEE